MRDFLDSFFMLDFFQRVKDVNIYLQFLQGILELILKVAFLRLIYFGFKERFFSRIVKNLRLIICLFRPNIAGCKYQEKEKKNE